MDYDKQSGVLYGQYGDNTNHSKNVCFDFDFTLVKPIKGKFSKSSTDWTFCFKEIPDLLRDISKHSNIVIFSNQNGLKTQEKIDIFKSKITNFYTLVDVPFKIFASLEKNTYRKPQTGMWDLFGSDLPSIYIGDAAGRRSDFSASDRKFAENIQIPFYTPEEYIYGIKPKYMDYTFNPYTFKSKPLKCSISTDPIILLVGLPGCGKSTYVVKCLKDYSIINQDSLKTRSKVLKETEKCLQNNIKCVIDSTNVSKQKRKDFIELAKKYDKDISVIEFTTDIEICKHNMTFRSVTTNTPRIPDLVYNMMKKQYESPEKSEGFNTVSQVQFTIDIPPAQWRKWYL